MKFNIYLYIYKLVNVFIEKIKKISTFLFLINGTETKRVVYNITKSLNKLFHYLINLFAKCILPQLNMLLKKQLYMFFFKIKHVVFFQARVSICIFIKQVLFYVLNGNFNNKKYSNNIWLYITLNE